MRTQEVDVLKATLAATQWQMLYFQARDEVRKANKGLARLARNNQVLRDKIMHLLAKDVGGVAIDNELAKLFRESKIVQHANGNGHAHV
jgi:hypothetical protein